jgi:hypothetical protein
MNISPTTSALEKMASMNLQTTTNQKSTEGNRRRGKRVTPVDAPLAHNLGFRLLDRFEALIGWPNVAYSVPVDSSTTSDTFKRQRFIHVSYCSMLHTKDPNTIVAA